MRVLRLVELALAW